MCLIISCLFIYSTEIHTFDCAYYNDKLTKRPKNVESEEESEKIKSENNTKLEIIAIGANRSKNIFAICTSQKQLQIIEAKSLNLLNLL